MVQVLLVATVQRHVGVAWQGELPEKAKRISIESQSNVENEQTWEKKEEGEEGRWGRARGGKEGEGKCTVEVFTTQVNSLSITISGRESLLLELS